MIICVYYNFHRLARVVNLQIEFHDLTLPPTRFKTPSDAGHKEDGN